MNKRQEKYDGCGLIAAWVMPFTAGHVLDRGSLAARSDGHSVLLLGGENRRREHVDPVGRFQSELQR